MSDVSNLVATHGGEFTAWRQNLLVRPPRVMTPAGHQVAARMRTVHLGGGGCGQFCAVWMRNVKTRQDFFADPNVVEDAQWMSGTSTSAEDYLLAHGFRAAPAGAGGAFATLAPQALVDRIVASGPGYYMVTISDVPQNGVAGGHSKVHAVAFVMMRTFQFFDPNYGVARFQTAAAIRGFFPAYYRLKLSIFPNQGYFEKFVG